MTQFFNRFAKDESGATAIEYGLIAALIAVVIIGAATTLGSNVSKTFSTIANNVGVLATLLLDSVRRVKRPPRVGNLEHDTSYEIVRVRDTLCRVFELAEGSSSVWMVGGGRRRQGARSVKCYRQGREDTDARGRWQFMRGGGCRWTSWWRKNKRVGGQHHRRRLPFICFVT